jgi:hypothetical protein
MKITVKIPEALVPSYESFILKYFAKQKFDEDSGAIKLVPQYTLEEYILMQIDALSDRVESEFPSQHTAEERAQIEALQQQMKEKRKAVKS